MKPERRAQIALVVIAWGVQPVATAPLVYALLDVTTAPAQFRPDLYSWLSTIAPVLPLALVANVALALALRSLWRGRPDVGRVAIVVLIAVLTFAAYMAYDLAQQDEVEVITRAGWQLALPWPTTSGYALD